MFILFLCYQSLFCSINKLHFQKGIWFLRGLLCGLTYFFFFFPQVVHCIAAIQILELLLFQCMVTGSNHVISFGNAKFWPKKGGCLVSVSLERCLRLPAFMLFSVQCPARSRACSWMSMKWFFTLCMKFCFWGGTNEDIGIVLQCLDVMFAKRRKQVSQQRALAFLKRLSILALHVLPNSSVGILATNRIFMQVSLTCSDF